MKIFVAIGLLLCCINVALGARTFCLPLTPTNTTTCLLTNANTEGTSDSVADAQGGNSAITYVVMDSTASEHVLQFVLEKFTALKELAVPFGNIKNLGTIRKGTSDTSDLTALQKLQIKNSELTTLTLNAFQKCTALLHLDLSQNKITTFTSGWDNSLDKLLSLNMAFNQIASLTSASTKLTLLEVFNISGNALTAVAIPTESVALKQIDLSRNKITTIAKDQFNRYPKLVEIRLEENSFTTLDSDTFKDLTSLTFLSVGGHKLSSFDFLAKATKLETLNISKTAISQLSDKTLETNTNLKYLYISHNELTDLHTSTLKNNKNLVLLDVSSNRISHVERDLFDTLTNIKAANFSCNQCMSENFASKPTAEQMKACNSSPSIIISTALTFIFVAITKML